MNINICDEKGVVESNADQKMRISVEGGELLAFGSANPRTEESYLSGEFTSFHGRTQAVIRVGNEEKLKICVTTEKEQAEASFEIAEK